MTHVAAETREKVREDELSGDKSGAKSPRKLLSAMLRLCGKGKETRNIDRESRRTSCKEKWSWCYEEHNTTICQVRNVANHCFQLAHSPSAFQFRPTLLHLSCGLERQSNSLFEPYVPAISSLISLFFHISGCLESKGSYDNIHCCKYANPGRNVFCYPFLGQLSQLPILSFISLVALKVKAWCSMASSFPVPGAQLKIRMYKLSYFQVLQGWLRLSGGLQPLRWIWAG